MDITRTFFHFHHLDLSVKKSKIMTHDAATGKVNFQSANLCPITLEQVLSFKYLGIPLCSSPYGLFNSFNEQIRKKAVNYLYSVLSLVKTGPDRSDLAYTLWTRCALPAILYGAEIIPLTQTTINEVERCQCLVGKFILQLPRNSSNVCANIDAGLKPVWAIIAEKVIKYAYNIMLKPSSYWPKLAMNENISIGALSPYTRYLQKWKGLTNSFGINPSQIKKSVNLAAISSILKEQRSFCVSSFAMNAPDFHQTTLWFKPKKWVNDSCFTKIFAEFRSCNANLGNRGPTKDGRFFKLCPLCSKVNVTAINNEVCLLIYFQIISFPLYSGSYAHRLPRNGPLPEQM